jgi:hypothetical protein
MAIPTVVMARHGDASIAGGERRSAARVSAIGEKLERRKKSRAAVLRWAFIRLEGEPRHDVGEGEGDSERRRGARLCAGVHARREDEDDALFDFFLSKGYAGCAGFGCWTGPGLLVGCAGGLGRAGKVQVKLLSFFSFIYFLFYISYFVFCF